MHTVTSLNTTSLNVMSLDGAYLVQGRGIPVLRVACSFFCPLWILHGLQFSKEFSRLALSFFTIFWRNPLKTDCRKPRKLFFFVVLSVSFLLIKREDEHATFYSTLGNCVLYNFTLSKLLLQMFLKVWVTISQCPCDKMLKVTIRGPKTMLWK